MLIYLAQLTHWRAIAFVVSPVAMASAAAFITLVLLFFHFILAPTLAMVGWMLWASYLLHYAAPLIYLAYWAVFAPHGTLRWPDIGPVLLPGLVYLGWVLARGAVVHDYPYDIINADKAGYGGVAIGASIILVAVSIFSLLLIGFDRWRGGRMAAR